MGTLETPSRKAKRIQRANPQEVFRAYCEVKGCNWVGNWRSVWHKWDTLLEEIDADLTQHNQEIHNELRTSDTSGT